MGGGLIVDGRSFADTCCKPLSVAGTTQGGFRDVSSDQGMHHLEGLDQQEEEYLSRQIKFEPPPSDSYKSHGCTTSS